MSHRIISLFTAALLAGGLAGCGKKAEPVAETKPEAKHDENIVTLTAENLKHITLKTEPATSSSLGMTLKAAGRISANLNKTAKVTSTFEGRLTKLNFDLNDRVTAGQVMALVESPELLGRQLEIKAPIDGVIIERKPECGLCQRGRGGYRLAIGRQVPHHRLSLRINALQLRQQIRADGQQIATGQSQNLAHVAEAGAHDLGPDTVLLVVLVNARDRLNPWVVDARFGCLVPLRSG